MIACLLTIQLYTGPHIVLYQPIYAVCKIIDTYNGLLSLDCSGLWDKIGADRELNHDYQYINADSCDLKNGKDFNSKIVNKVLDSE